LIEGAIFVKSKDIQRFCEGIHTFLLKFPQILPGFSPNQKF